MEIDKIARSRSKDQLQEQLRSSKENWNAEVKTLIALLIGFKKGMNGRGDQKLGIPPSNIKDPLPSQMGHFLSEISSRYSKVIDDASKLIDAQTYYSEHRRKPQEQSQIVTTDSQPELIAEGSWWGSRMWARVSLLKQIDRENRKLRLDMLGAGADIIKAFKNFESEILDYKNPDSIANSINILANTANIDISAVFLQSYDKLAELYKGLEKVAPGTAEPEKPKKLKETIKEEKAELPNEEVSADPVSAPSVNVVTPESSSNDEWTEFKNIHAQMVVIGVVINYLTNEENLDKLQTQAIRPTYDDFSRNVAVFYDLSKRKDQDVIELNKLAVDIESEYKELLHASTEILGPAKDFKELAKRVPRPKMAEYLAIVDNQEQLEKLAAGSVSRWLRKNWLSINPSNMDRIRINMADSSEKLRKQLDSLLDSLENRETGIKEISKKLSYICKIIVGLIEQAILLAENQVVSHRKDKTTSLIDKTDITYLKEYRRNFEKYI